MWDDPIVRETRKVRNEIAAQSGYDLQALGEYFKAMRAADAAKSIAALISAPPSGSYPAYDDSSLIGGLTVRDEPTEYGDTEAGDNASLG